MWYCGHQYADEVVDSHREWIQLEWFRMIWLLISVNCITEFPELVAIGAGNRWQLTFRFRFHFGFVLSDQPKRIRINIRIRIRTEIGIGRVRRTEEEEEEEEGLMDILWIRRRQRQLSKKRKNEPIARVMPICLWAYLATSESVERQAETQPRHPIDAPLPLVPSYPVQHPRHQSPVTSHQSANGSNRPER